MVCELRLSSAIVAHSCVTHGSPAGSRLICGCLCGFNIFLPPSLFVSVLTVAPGADWAAGNGEPRVVCTRHVAFADTRYGGGTSPVVGF